MGRAFRAIWLGIVDAYGELFPVVGMNLLWLLFNIPIVMVGMLVIQLGVGMLSLAEDAASATTLVLALLFAVLLVIGPNPAASGIHLWANRLAKEERVEFGLFWEGLRTYLRPALLLFLISFLGFLLLFSNAIFYLTSETTALRIFGILWLYAILIWFAMQIYMLPLLVEQEDKRLSLVLRNSFFLTISNAIPTLVLLVVCALLVFLSLGITLLIALVTGSLVVLIAARALQLILERYRPAAQPPS